MDRRYGHIGRSSRDKERYVRHLGEISYTPTAEESFRFPESDNLEEDNSVQQATGKRRQPTPPIIEHFKANWIGWVVVAFIAIAIYFATDFSRTLGSMENMLDEVRRALGTFEGKIENIEDQIKEQEMKLREQNIKIDYLEKSLGK